MSTAVKKYKVCRRLGAGVYEKCQTQKFALVETRGVSKKRGARRSDFGQQLIEKQRVRFMYGVREKQFANYVEKAMTHTKKGLTPADFLFNLLEQRLDNVIYRLGLAQTRAFARQMVSHGHILVNGVKTNVPSQAIQLNDTISIREGSKSSKMFENLDTKLKNYSTPEWLRFDTTKLTATIVGEPKNPDPFLNFQSVIEFYTR